MTPIPRPPYGEHALPLGWICTALERDRSNLLVLALTPDASTAEIPALLAERLATRCQVVIAELAGVETENALERIVAGRASKPSEAAHTQILAMARECSEQGAGLVLALPDATQIPAGTLRHLGHLVAASKHGLRLAFFADCTPEESASAAASLVRELGCGVQKILLGRPDRRVPISAAPEKDERPDSQEQDDLEASAEWYPVTAGPPRVDAQGGPRRPITQSIRVRTRHSEPRSWGLALRNAAIACGAIGLLVALPMIWGEKLELRRYTERVVSRLEKIQVSGAPASGRAAEHAVLRDNRKRDADVVYADSPFASLVNPDLHEEAVEMAFVERDPEF